MAIDTIGTNAITNDAVTAAKIPSGAVVADIGDGTITTAKLAADSVTNAKIADSAVQSENVKSSLMSHKNMIINGDWQIWQRRTAGDETHEGINPGVPVSADRWSVTNQGTTKEYSNWDLDRQEDTPAGEGFKWSGKFTATTVNSSPSNNTAANFFQSVHYLDLIPLAWGTSSAKTTTISFWVKASKTGTFPFSLRYSGTGSRRFNKGYTVNTADTWERKTIVVDGPTDSAYDHRNLSDLRGTVGAQLQWWWASGSDFIGTRTDGWQNGNASIVDTNDAQLNASGDYVYITGCQWELGGAASDYEHLSFDAQLNRCHEYYFKTGAVGKTEEWFPGVTTYAGYDGVTAASAGTQDRPYLNLTIPRQMNVNPTVTYWPGRDGVTATAGRISVYNGNTSVTTSSKPSGGYGTRIDGYFQGTSTDTIMYTLHVELDGEI